MIASPILLDFPLSIKTYRLTIRSMMPGDGRIVWQAIEESRESLTKWLLWVPEVKCWQDSEKNSSAILCQFHFKERFLFSMGWVYTFIFSGNGFSWIIALE